MPGARAPTLAVSKRESMLCAPRWISCCSFCFFFSYSADSSSRFFVSRAARAPATFPSTVWMPVSVRFKAVSTLPDAMFSCRDIFSSRV